MIVSRSGCNRSVLNDCGHILNQCEQDGRSVINDCEQKTALLSITAVYVLNPLQLAAPRGFKADGSSGPENFPIYGTS